MEMQKIYLWENEKDVPLFDAGIGQEMPSITPFLLNDGKGHGAMIVAPGGAYTHKAAHEGAPVAQRLNEMGINAFVLDYRVHPYHAPVPVLDAQRAIRTVRARAEEFGVLPDKIGFMGFSAGGHLTGLCGTQYDAGNPDAGDPVERVSCRPDAIAPCYGVLNINMMRSADFNEYMTGERDLDIRRVRALSPEYHVTPDTPPCFLWHTATDPIVMVESSIDFAQKCADQNVPVSLHVYPFGRHGLDLGNEKEAPGTTSWSGLLGKFLHQLGF